jgi:hypothetical protein
MPRRADACQACSREFAIGDRIVAELHATAAGYERQDFCTTCRPTANVECLATWLWRRAATPTAARPLSFDREAILAFFERLSAQVNPAQAQFRFVLALLLWRKKALRFDKSVPNEHGEDWDFVEPRSGRKFSLPRPELDEREIEALSQQLESLLSGAQSVAVAEDANV